MTHKRYGSVEAGNVFITVNGFANELTQGLDIKPVRNQVLVTDIIEGLRLKGCYHMDKGYFYFRNVGKRILIGGGRHKLGNAEETNVLNQTHDAATMLKEILNDHLEGGIDAEIKYHWSGILGVGGDKKPIIKEMEKGIYTGVRMGGMGVAICSVVGKQLAELTQK